MVFIFNKEEDLNEVNKLTEDIQEDEKNENGEIIGIDETVATKESELNAEEVTNDNEIEQTIDKPSEETEDIQDEDEGLKAQEDIDKQRMEKAYRKQEEEWISKREKVS